MSQQNLESSSRTVNEVETWKPIPLTDGRYEASTHGRIRSLYGGGKQRKLRELPKILQPFPSEDGYLVVGLRRDGKRWCTTVNFAVCSAFHGPQPTADHEASHMDGTRTNNVPGNLVWATSKENNQHKWQHGTQTIRTTRIIAGRQTYRCTKCNVWLPAERFYPSKATRHGLQSWCRECTNRDRVERKRRARQTA